MKELQNQIIRAAEKRLQKYAWFDGVCLDELPGEYDLEQAMQQGKSFAAIVDVLVADTIYWDGDQHYNGSRAYYKKQEEPAQCTRNW